MRHLVATVLFIAGCAAQGLPLDNNGQSGGGGNGGSGGGAVDMAHRDLGGPGAHCMSACDCMPGLACRMNGMCGMSPVGQVYCCDSNDCPKGSFCQTSSGMFSQCGGGGGNGGGPGGGGGGGPGGGGGGGGGFGGGPGGGGGDGGVGQFCHFIPCSSDTTCKQIGCGSCNAAQKTCNM